MASQPMRNRLEACDSPQHTVPASGKLTHSAGRLAAAPQVKRRQEAFVIAGILDFCPALLFVKRKPDNNYINNDNSRTVGY